MKIKATKIDFKTPKYIIPLIVTPLILLVHYSVSGMFVKSKVVVKDEHETFNTTIPSPSKRVEDENSKLSLYEDRYGKKGESGSRMLAIESTSDLSGYDDLLNEYSDEELAALGLTKSDLLNVNSDDLKKELTQSKQDLNKRKTTPRANNTYTYNEKVAADAIFSKPKQKEDSRTSEEKELDMFRKQMLIMDSISTGKTQVAKKTENQTADEKEEKYQRDVEKMTMSNSYSRTTLGNKTTAFNTITQTSKTKASGVRALIDMDAKAYQASRIRIKLLADVFIKDIKIPKGSFVYAFITGFSTQRVFLNIEKVVVDDHIIDVELDIHDLDGYLGLYVPQSIFREFTKDLGDKQTKGMSQIQTQDENELTRSFIQSLVQTSVKSTSQLIKENKVFFKQNHFIYIIQN